MFGVQRLCSFLAVWGALSCWLLGLAWGGPGSPPIDPPQFVNAPIQYVVEGALLVDEFEVWARGWEVEQVTFTLKGPMGMRLAVMGRHGCCSWRGMLIWRPGQSDVSTTGHRVEIEATVPGGQRITQSYFLYVINRNDPPQITSTPTLQATQALAWQYKIIAQDLDPTADTLQYRLLQKPAGMTLNASGTVAWTPTASQAGRFEVVVEVTDGRGGRTLQSFVLTVATAPQPPVFRSLPLEGGAVGVPYLYTAQATDPNPNDVLQYKLISGPTGMTLTGQSTLQWTPTAAGTFAVLVEVTDSAGAKAQQPFNIKVAATAGNAPQWTSQPTRQAHQGQPWTYDAKAADSDGDTMHIVLEEAPVGMVLVAKGSGAASLAWTPGSATTQGLARVVLRVDDNKGGVAWQRFVLQVTSLPTAPQFLSLPPLQTLEHTPFLYQAKVQAQAGTVWRFSLNQAPAGMQIDAATGLLLWTPGTTQIGAHVIDILVEGDRGGRGNQRFTLQVIDQNDVPQITSTPPKEATKGALFQYQLKATDPDGATEVLGYRWQRHPPAMKLDPKTGAITWTPQHEDVGSHTITAEVFDTRGGRGTQTFVLVVKPANDPPRVLSLPVVAAQVGILYAYQIRAYDPDSTGLQFSLAQGPQGLKLDPLSGLITWTPQAQDAGDDQKPVRILISDRIASVTHSFGIRVYAKNQPPVISSATTIQAQEGSALKHQIEAKDPDGDKLVYVVESGPDGLKVDVVSGLIEWTPAAGQVGTFGVQVRVDDQRGGLVALRLSFEVANQNSPPSISSRPTLYAVMGQSYVYIPRATDPDAGTTLQWSLITGPTGMTLDNTTGRLQWTPTAQQIGVHDVVLQVSDGVPGGTTTQQFLVWVQGANRAPTFQATVPPAQAQQDQLYQHLFTATDPDIGEPLAFSLLAAPDGATIGVYTGLFTWSPTGAQVGMHTLSVLVRDPLGSQAIRRFSIEVVAQNRAPRIESFPPDIAAVGQHYLYQVKATDPDGDPVTLRLAAQPSTSLPAAKMTLDAKGQLSWIPSANHAGKRFLIAIQATDNRQGETWQHFVIRVGSGANQPPTWKVTPPSGTVKRAQGQLFTLVLSATDPDGDALDYRLDTGPAGMLLRAQGTLQWTPTAQQVGAHTVLVTATDGKGGSVRALWQIEVSNTNDPPQIVSTPHTQIKLGQTFAYQVRLQDPDTGVDPQEQLSLLLAIAPPGMTLDPMTRTLTWTPQAKDVGQHVVQVRARDRLGLAATQQFLVVVTADAQTPQIVSSAPTQVSEGELYQYQVKVAVPEEGLWYQLLLAPTGMAIDARTGIVTWRPTNLDATRKSATIRLQVTGPGGAAATQSFVIQVQNVNEAPRFISPPCREALTGVYNCVLLVEDADPLPWQLTVTKVIGPDGLQAQVGKGTTGQRVSVLLKWSPAPEDVGSHLVVLEVNDGAASESLSFHIVVRSNRDAPVADPGLERDLVIEPGEFLLDGSASRDAKGDKSGLSYEWSLVEGPTTLTIPTPKSPKVRLVLRTSGAYIFQLVVRKDGKESAPAQVRVSVRNLPPTATLLAPVGANVERLIQLDASGSDDANGDVLGYRWQQRAGPTVNLDLSDPTIPTWTPTKPGLYQFELVVEEARASGLRSKPALVEIAVHAPAEGKDGVFIPHAVIIAPALGIVGSTVVLDGSRSRGLTAERLQTGLQYEWRVINGPATSGLSAPKQAKTNFVPQQAGLYQIGLIVRNNLHRSREALLSLFVRDKTEAPLPLAVPTQRYAVFAQWSKLDGSQSRASAGRQLSFLWTQELSLGGLPVTLRDARSFEPSFFPLSRSPYFFQLQVRADGPDSPDSVPVSFMVLVNAPGNQPPVANAGDDKDAGKAVMAGQVTTLDAAKSQDPDAKEGKGLLYQWRQTSGFPVALHDAHKANPSFVPVTYGILSFSLQVYDGTAWSWPDTIQVVVHDATNHVPTADPGPAQKVSLGQSVTLDGSKSNDLDRDDVLTFHWRLVSPQGVQLPLDLVDPKRPSFTAKDPTIARYVFGLRVDDGKIRSLERTVTIQVLGAGQPPVAKIDGVTEAFVGDDIVLDGSGSSDPDGDKLTFAWEQLSGEEKIVLKSAQESKITLQFSVEGTYQFQLKVSDGSTSSAPRTITIVVKKRSTDPAGCGCQAQPQRGPGPGLVLCLLWLCLLWRRRTHTEGM